MEAKILLIRTATPSLSAVGRSKMVLLKQYLFNYDTLPFGTIQPFWLYFEKGVPSNYIIQIVVWGRYFSEQTIVDAS